MEIKNNIEDFEERAEILKAIAHPVRLCIVKGLIDSGECNVSKIHSCLGAPQSTVSQHLSKLKSAGIIRGERSGTEIIYSVENKMVIDVVSALFK